MKPRSPVTGIPLQFHSCYLRFLIMHLMHACVIQVRFNLDPFGHATDSEMWEVLDAVQLRGAISTGGYIPPTYHLSAWHTFPNQNSGLTKISLHV
jgi:hypothetical protein